MLRGLIIRQAFMLVDLVLVVLLLLVGYVVFQDVFAKDAEDTAVRPAASGGGDAALDIASVGSRSDYDVIASNKLFGAAGQTNQIPEEDTQNVEGPAVPNTDFILLATAATYPTDPLSSAVIKEKRTNSEKTYYMGQPLSATLTLVEVHKRKVILQNKGKNKREVLTMEEPEKEKGPGAVPPPRGLPSARRQPPRPPGKGVNIKREEIYKELSSDKYAEVALQVNPQLHKDAKGKVDGITSSSLSRVPLAQKIGLKDNDIIQKVNGVAIDSQEKLMKIVTDFRNARDFNISILRNGKPQTLTFHID